MRRELHATIDVAPRPDRLDVDHEIVHRNNEDDSPVSHARRSMAWVVRERPAVPAKWIRGDLIDSVEYAHSKRSIHPVE